MIKRVAIPLNEGKLSEYLADCSHYHIYEIDGVNIEHSSLQAPALKGIEELPLWIADQGITDIIAFKMDRKIVSLFTGYKINIFLGAPFVSPRELITEYVNGRLTSNEQVIKEITN